jgi:hypothetical protein
MEVTELLAGLDREITQADETVNWLLTELAQAQQRLTDLRIEAKAVRSAVQRLSGGPAATTAPDPSWLTISGVDAVERALNEAGPLHLHEIADLLVSKGRDRQAPEHVSANLSQLRKKRGTVVNVGKGRWDYLRPPLRLVAGEVGQV